MTKVRLMDLLCVSYLSMMNYCMPLCPKYTAYNEFLVIVVWNDVESDFTFLPENFVDLRFLQNHLAVLQVFHTPFESPPPITLRVLGLLMILHSFTTPI